MKARRFTATTQATRQFLVGADRPVELIKDALNRQLDTLTGPRGGRYEPLGPTEYIGQFETAEDFMRNTYTFLARRRGRYVRPKR